MSTVDKIIAYGSVELEPDEVVALFQQLLDCGVIWHLQGACQQQAQRFLDAGLITNSPNHGARKRASKRGRKAKARPQSKSAAAGLHDPSGV